MARDVSSTIISGSSIYSYTEVEDWKVTATRCTYTHTGGVTSPYNWGINAASELQWWESGTWHTYASGSGYFSGYGDLELASTSDSFVRQAEDRLVSLGCLTTVSGSSARAWIDYTVPHLAPSVDLTGVTRNSDNSVTLSWSAPALEYEAMCLEVSIDGGSWSEFEVLWNTATSYTWTGASDDHAYRFRIRTYYKASYSAYDEWADAIVMAPAAPQSISTTAVSGTTVTVNLVNPSPVATSVRYQLSDDDGATWGAVQESQSLTSFSVTISGTGRVRAWNHNATGDSAAITSDTIVTIAPPAKPTITSPVGGVWDVSQPLTVSWIHNPVDGSAQTAARIRIVKQLPPIEAHTVTLDPFTGDSTQLSWADVQSWLGVSLGDAIAVAVATKGADASFSSNSTAKGIVTAQAPTISIAKPEATIEGMPIEVEATYTDSSGTCQAASASLRYNGREVYAEDMAITTEGGVTKLTASIDTGEFLPTNGESYTLYMTARSSSSLQTSANATFTVDFVEPQAGELNISNDPETGYASLLATFDNSASEVEYIGETNEQYESTEGYVRSLTVEGKSEKWNQLLDKSRYSATQTVNGVTFTNNGDGTITVNGTASARATFIFQRNAFDFVQGHKYIGLGIGSTTSVFLGIDSTHMSFSMATQPIREATYSEKASYSYYRIEQGGTANNVTLTPAIIDLTAIFGAGNEPATVDAFKATDVYKAKLAAGELYAYDAGSLASIEGVSVGDGTITTPLRSAGSVHDELQADADSWTVERKVGYVLVDGTNIASYGINDYTDNVRVNVYLPEQMNVGTTNLQNRLLVVADKLNTSIDVTARPQMASAAYCCCLYSNIFLFCIPKSELSEVSKDGANAWLALHPILVCYPLATPTQDPETSMSAIEIGSAFTVATDLDTTFEMTTWDGSADAVSISVSRVNADGTLTPLITDGESGAGAVDKYAPLNTPYRYAITTTADTNAVKTVYVDNEFITRRWYAYSGDIIAAADYTTGGTRHSYSRPNRVRVHYVGRRDPVSYDDGSVNFSVDTTYFTIEKSQADAFELIMENDARGVVKTGDGLVFHADFELSASNTLERHYSGKLTFKAHRIEGDRL